MAGSEYSLEDWPLVPLEPLLLLVLVLLVLLVLELLMLELLMLELLVLQWLRTVEHHQGV